MNFTLKVIENNRTIQTVRTHSIRRFTNSLRMINWPELKRNDGLVYLRVFYGNFIDVFGKNSAFFNDGFWNNEKDLWLAFNAFKED